MTMVISLFLILFFPLQVLAAELEVLPYVFAANNKQIAAVDFFATQKLPSELAHILQGEYFAVDFGENETLTVTDNAIMAWLRGSILKFNQANDEKIILKVPQVIQIHPATKRLSRETLKSAITEKVHSHCPGCEVEIAIEGDIPLTTPLDHWEILAKEDNWRGKVSAVLKVAGESKILPMNVTWYDYPVVATTDIQVGELGQKSNIASQRKDVTFWSRSYFTDVEKVLGMRNTKDVRRGQILDKTHFKKVSLVKYGQPLLGTLSDGDYQISVNCMAKGTGALGDVIPVSVGSTKKKVMAKIIDKDTVRIQ